MSTSRKEKPSYLAKNIKYLRKKHGETLEEMAAFLGLKGKPSYIAYEKERAIPDIHKLMRLATRYGLSVEDLVYKYLEISEKVKDINNTGIYEIPLIPAKVAAGAAKGFGDPEFIATLPKISIPFKPYGIARAFEIQGDSMTPDIVDGSIVVGIKVGRGELQNNKTYIVVTTEGPQCKQVQLGDNHILYLISKNPHYPIRHIAGEEVIEMYEYWKKIG